MSERRRTEVRGPRKRQVLKQCRSRKRVSMGLLGHSRNLQRSYHVRTVPRWRMTSGENGRNVDLNAQNLLEIGSEESVSFADREDGAGGTERMKVEEEKERLIPVERRVLQPHWNLFSSIEE